MNILFYDSEFTGHHKEYIIHLIHHLNNVDDKINNYIFVVNERIYQEIFTIKSTKKIVITPIENLFGLNNPTGFSGILRAKLEIKCVNHYCIKYQIDKCFFLNINPILPTLTSGIFAVKCRQIHGIHFHPYYRLEPNSLKDKILYRLKKYMLFLAAKNKKVRTIFILNDPWVCEKLNLLMKNKDVFRPLPDPISDIQIPKIEGTNKRKNLMLWGYLNQRKGLLNLLDSILYIDEDLIPEFILIFAGEIDPKFKDLFLKKIEYIKSAIPNVGIELHEGFIPEEQLPKILANADLLLAPYTKIQGSSGILGWAAKTRKPILSPDTGLIGQLVNNYKIGITVKTNNPKSIAEGIKKFISNKYSVSEAGQQKYTMKNRPREFASTILKSLVQ